MRTLEAEVKKYLSKTNKYLLCDGKRKKEILKEIETSIYEIAEKEGITNLKQIYDHFGTPEETASTYLSQADPKKIKRAVDLRRTVFLTIAIGVAIALVIYVIAIATVIIAENVFSDDITIIEAPRVVEECMYPLIRGVSIK